MTHNTHWWMGHSIDDWFVNDWKDGLNYMYRRNQNVSIETIHGGQPFVFPEHPFKRCKAVTEHPSIVNGLQSGKIQVSAPVVFNLQDTWRYCSPQLLYNLYPVIARSSASEYDLRFLHCSSMDNSGNPLNWLNPSSFLAESKQIKVLEALEHDGQTDEFMDGWVKKWKAEIETMIRKACKKVYAAEKDIRKGGQPFVNLWVRFIPVDKVLPAMILPGPGLCDKPGSFAAKPAICLFKKDDWSFFELPSIALVDALDDDVLTTCVRTAIIRMVENRWLKIESKIGVQVYGSVLEGLYHFKPKNIEFTFVGTK
jgi:hypothetical protein